MTTVETVVSSENMQQAWQRVKANKGAAGIDEMSITDYPEFARANWVGIKASLLDGTYTPAPVKRVEIPKDSGGTRPLGIPTVSDRVIQQAIAQVLVPVFDPQFSESSYGFRPGHSAYQ
jgi:RNA-directed DNA polymerase